MQPERITQFWPGIFGATTAMTCGIEFLDLQQPTLTAFDMAMPSESTGSDVSSSDRQYESPLADLVDLADLELVYYWWWHYTSRGSYFCHSVAGDADQIRLGPMHGARCMNCTIILEVRGKARKVGIGMSPLKSTNATRHHEIKASLRILPKDKHKECHQIKFIFPHCDPCHWSSGLASQVPRLHLKVESGFLVPEMSLHILWTQLQQPLEEIEFAPTPETLGT